MGESAASTDDGELAVPQVSRCRRRLLTCDPQLTRSPQTSFSAGVTWLSVGLRVRDFHARSSVARTDRVALVSDCRKLSSEPTRRLSCITVGARAGR